MTRSMFMAVIVVSVVMSLSLNVFWMKSALKRKGLMQPYNGTTPFEYSNKADFRSTERKKSDVKDKFGKNGDGFAACLLVMDDNHYLIEWLSYHYYVLPLKYLIVAVDPRSKTSPHNVLNRWRAAKNGNETVNRPGFIPSIIVWYNDSDYVSNAQEWMNASYWVRAKFGGSAEIEHPGSVLPPELVQHRTRQRLFYHKCMQQHYDSNRSWTLLTDTDEFLTINYATIQNLTENKTKRVKMEFETNASRIITPFVPTVKEFGSIWNFIHNSNNQRLFFPFMVSNEHMVNATDLAWIPNQTPCIQIPRRRFGALVTSTSASKYDMLTTKYMHHAADDNYMFNRISKVMINLQYLRHQKYGDNITVPNKFRIEPVNSIHRPIPEYCNKRKMHIRAHQQVFIINHYLGTWEQYNYRDDSRRKVLVDENWKLDDQKQKQNYLPERSYQKYNKTAQLKQRRTNDIKDWIDGFIEHVGYQRAHYLLMNVGELEPI